MCVRECVFLSILFYGAGIVTLYCTPSEISMHGFHSLHGWLETVSWYTMARIICVSEDATNVIFHKFYFAI